MTHKVTQKNYNQVVDNFASYLKKYFEEGDTTYKSFAVEWLNDVLNDIALEDGFGTEGQSDPRGDQRD